jgi:hypothetical protein
VAQEILKMRAVMSLLVRERTTLGDHEPIIVNSFFIARRRPTRKPLAARVPTYGSVLRRGLAERV